MMSSIRQISDNSRFPQPQRHRTEKKIVPSILESEILQQEERARKNNRS